MDPITMMLIGGGGGLLKSELIDRPQYLRDVHLDAQTQQLSPWTGLRGTPGKTPDPFGSTLQYGLAGGQMGASLQNAEASRNLNNAYAGWLRRGGGIYGAPVPNSAQSYEMGYPAAGAGPSFSAMKS